MLVQSGLSIHNRLLYYMYVFNADCFRLQKMQIQATLYDQCTGAMVMLMVMSDSVATAS